MEQFHKPDLRAIHRNTFGQSDAKVTPSAVRNAIHLRYWQLASRLEGKSPDSLGRTYKIKEHLIEGKQVCLSGFRRAVGGARRAHEDMVLLVLRGYGPDSLNGVQEGKVLLKAHAARNGRHHARTAFARCWWAEELQLHDWMPNEQCLQFKGPEYSVVHSQCYTEVASAHSGYPPLKYRAWKKQMLPGARQLGESLCDCLDPDKIRVRRSARHSHFPECTTCLHRRSSYQRVYANPRSSEAERFETWTDLKQHMDEWQGDRKVALRLKDSSCGTDKDRIYECDDKCGSQWLELPVPPKGRDSKALAKNKFKFCLQCNTVVGKGGVNRFMVVPKHIATGGNFGLTCLYRALWQAYKSGRLKGGPVPSGRVMYRHTDGGSDNLNHDTHLFHWMLVWLGIFDEVVWFRFDAGHSHTELADRFFSMLKRIFFSGGKRALRLDSFPEFEQRLNATFKNSVEAVQFEYLFANWDFHTWFKNGGLQPHKDFGGVSFDNVFRYKYDSTKWDQGGVMIQFKPRLSWQSPTPDDCEWSPFEAKQVLVGGQTVMRNVATTQGVQIIGTPPRMLLQEPDREDFTDKSAEKPSAASVIDNMLKKREGTEEELSREAHAHWTALASVFRHTRAAQIPDMPHDAAHGHTFVGCPTKLIPMLKAMMRFDRPLTYWDPFSEEPPAAWPDAAAAEAARNRRAGGTHDLRGAGADVGGAGAGAQQPPRRDPREYNNVTGAHRPAAQKTRDGKEVRDEQWAKDFKDNARQFGRIVSGRIFLMQLHVAENGCKLGFAMAGNAQPQAAEAVDEQHEALWYGADFHGPWGANPIFIPCMNGGKRQKDMISVEAFLFEVEDSWLTESSVPRKHEHLRLNSDCVRRLQCLITTWPTIFVAPPPTSPPPRPPRPPAPADPPPAAAPAPAAAGAKRHAAPPQDGPDAPDPKRRETMPAPAAAGAKRHAAPPQDGPDAPVPKRHEMEQLVMPQFPAEFEGVLPSGATPVHVEPGGLSAEQAAEIAIIMEAGIGHLPMYCNSGALLRKKSKDLLGSKREAVMVLDADKSILAVASFEKIVKEDRLRCCYLYELHVHRNVQKRKLGGVLLSWLEAGARSWHVSEIRLTADIDNPAAAESDPGRSRGGFYPKAGFEPIYLCDNKLQKTWRKRL